MPSLPHLTALYDANVLYPAPLRDLLMRLAMTGLIRAKWSEDIHAEWTRNLMANRPDIRPKHVERIKYLMNEHARDALVEGYQQLIPALHGLPDPNDRHVLAAAIVGHADVIVTFNLNDFPPSVLTPFGIEAQHPDEFIRHLIDLNSFAVCSAVQQQRRALKNPPKPVDTFLKILEQQRLPLTVAALRHLSQFL